MSQESLGQFMEKVGSNEELRASIENQLDSDGNISVGALITLGAENGCDFTADDLQDSAEMSDEELHSVAGGATQIEYGLLSAEVNIDRISSLASIGDNLDADFEGVATGLKKKKGFGSRYGKPIRN